jgi:hypothetical protein
VSEGEGERTLVMITMHPAPQLLLRYTASWLHLERVYLFPLLHCDARLCISIVEAQHIVRHDDLDDWLQARKAGSEISLNVGYGK